jgi:HTH-type transcriptional regulator/antitoxin HigA
LLEERGWSQVDFATRTGFTPKPCSPAHVRLLLQGKAAISEDTALRLERVLGSSARFWMSLGTQYREQLSP